MSNPFSGSEIPGMNAMGDTLSFVKKLWGNMQVPGMVAPPMSVDELDKKIQDLKTVESWLTVNMNMLRGTIQALEVQRATLAALQSIGESFAQHAQQAGTMAEQATTSSTVSNSGNSNSNSNADWPMHPHTAKAKVAEPDPDPDDEVDEDSADMPPEAGASAAEAEAPVEEPTQSTNAAKATKEADSADASTPFVNPAAWWGLLQEQFKQAVSKAMEGEQESSTTAEAVPVQKTAGKSTAGTATKTAKAGASAKAKPASKAEAGSKSVASSAVKPTAKPAAKTATKTATKPKAAAKPLAKTSKTTKAR